METSRNDYADDLITTIIRQKEIRIADLEAENATWRVASENHQQYDKLAGKYNELHKRYRDLERKQAEYAVYIKKAKEKYSEAKESARQWQAWIDNHRGRLRDGHPPEPHVAEAEATTTDSGELPSRASSESSVTEKARSPTGSGHGVGRVTSSQTTEGEPEPCPPLKPEPTSDDEPQVVSARSLKRRRSESVQLRPIRRIKQEPTSPTDPIELHSEDYSSPVLTRQKPVRADTSDLDAFVQHLDTPRRYRHQRGVSEEVSKPITLPTTTSSLSEGAAELAEDVLAVNPRTRHLDPAITGNDFVLQPGGGNSQSNALQPISANIPTMPRISLLQQSVKRKRRTHDVRAKVSLVSEDGEDQPNRDVAVKREDTPNTHASRRLESLLEEPSPNRLPLLKRRTPEGTTSRRKKYAPPINERLKSSAQIFSLQDTAAFKLPPGLEPPPPPVRPEDEPLRWRPLRKLNLEDFKINPKYMGADYAFADTFRGREKRRCLQGCTRPDCCGDAFRKAVELGGVPTTKSDAQVLEEFFGSSWRALMRAYSPERQKDSIKQAHAQAFAQEHGKHRHAFQRRSTPPGFWRTDMPTTQEEEEDRARAHEMEREKVEERWREAMREGGRWMFRDE